MLWAIVGIVPNLSHAMTINIALATYDGIILGCDSLSSMIDHVIFPFRDGCEYAKDASGQVITDAHGVPLIPAHGAHLSQVATTVFGGVSKMFCLYEDGDTVVAAITAGLATLRGVTISEQAKRYRRQNHIEERKFTTTEDVAEHFKGYMRGLWLEEFGNVPEEQRHFQPTVQFIVGGFGANDEYGKIFKIDVGHDLVIEQFPSGDHMGICWSGQADHVERLIRGVDRQLELLATRQMAEAISAQRATTLSDLSQSLQTAGVELPANLELKITECSPPTMPWESGQADIDYGNLSAQYAVELVEMLVNTQSGMQRFSRGIPVVGGRTHIGVLKRGDGFQLLNAPDLQ